MIGQLLRELLIVRRTICLLLFPLVLSTAAFADESARSLLDRMSHSFRELNYHGTFSYQQGDSIASLRIAHALIDGEEYERLQYLDGKPREIVRRGHTLSCIHPGHNLVRLYQQQKNLQLSSGENSELDQYYQFTIEGKGRIAGRDVIDLTVSPKDTHRYGYRLSLDEQTGLLLRSELVGPKGQVLERFQFVEITMEAFPADYFKDAENSYQAAHISPAEAVDSPVAAEGRWQVNWLPGGFTSTVENREYTTKDMVTFTDGLTVFSVFLERDVDQATMAQGVEGSAQRGATTAYSRALLLAGHPHRVTVVGEIPHQTAQQIAQSVALLDPRPER